jgi:hypothetical protein
MSAGPDDLRDAILRAPAHDPSIPVFRPRAGLLRIGVLVLFVGMLGSFFPMTWTWHPAAIVTFVVCSVGVFAWLRLAMPYVTLHGRGRNSWAVSETHLVYISPDGRVSPFSLAALQSVELNAGGVPVLSIAGTLDTGQHATLCMELTGLAWPGLGGVFARPGPPSQFVEEVERRRRALVAAPLASGEDLAPAGAALADLSEALADPLARVHLARAKVVERARFGRYEVVFLDATGFPGPVVRYSHRAIVVAPEGEIPVLAFNHEASLGGSFWGVHLGGRHTNLGEAPAEVGYAEFKERALAAVRGRLLAT